MMMMHSTGR